MYKKSIYLGKKISDLDWERHGIIALSIVLEGGRNEFIYASKIKNYTVKEDDVFVVVGYERDILEFEKRIGSDV
jgi:Trk K+ transport system NAD-binding subunit